MLGQVRRSFVGALVLSAAAIGGVGLATAQQLDPGISCLEGEVPPSDWAELTSKYKESIWDSKAAIRLWSQGDELELSVTDTYGTTVCENTADNKTRCKFNFPNSYSGIFNIRIDNLKTSTSRYRLCAE